MRAVVQRKYGTPDDLTVTEVPTPVPGPGEVLIQLQAVSLNGSDWETLRGRPAYARLAGLFRPRRQILGSDVAGRVTAVGPGATRFTPGDDVYGDILDRKGGFAEYVAAPEKALAPIPEGLSYADAAALPQAGAVALGAVRGIDPRPGQKVLVNGAGGGSGMYIVQLAKRAGAEVTGVDSAAKLTFVRSVGADHALDSEREDWTRSGRYDAVIDLAAYRSLRDYRRALNPGGRYLCVGGGLPTLLSVLLFGRLSTRRDGKRLGVLAVRLGVQHIEPLVEQVRSGAVSTYVDRSFPLEQAPEALRYVGDRLACGKVLVVMDDAG